MEGRERRTRQMDEIKSTAAVNLQGPDASSVSDSDLRDFTGRTLTDFCKLDLLEFVLIANCEKFLSR
jgi:hypothetical protein